MSSFHLRDTIRAWYPGPKRSRSLQCSSSWATSSTKGSGSKMKTTHVIGKYRLYVTGKEIGINVAESTEHWYWLGDWDAFRTNVETALADHAAVHLSLLTDEQLEVELERRRSKPRA